MAAITTTTTSNPIIGSTTSTPKSKRGRRRRRRRSSCRCYCCDCYCWNRRPRQFHLLSLLFVVAHQYYYCCSSGSGFALVLLPTTTATTTTALMTVLTSRAAAAARRRRLVRQPASAFAFLRISSPTPSLRPSCRGGWEPSSSRRRAAMMTRNGNDNDGGDAEGPPREDEDEDDDLGSSSIDGNANHQLPQQQQQHAEGIIARVDAHNDIQQHDDDDDDDEDANDIQHHLSKISWLPNIKTRGTTRPAAITNSAKYYGGSSTKNRSITLPVLPMTMVRGLGILGGGGPTEVGTTAENDSNHGDDEDEGDSTTTTTTPHHPSTKNRPRRAAAGTSSSSPSPPPYADHHHRRGNPAAADEEDATTILGVGGRRRGRDPRRASGGVASEEGPPFRGGTSSYLPHTRNHVWTASEPRYKRMYDDLALPSEKHHHDYDAGARREEWRRMLRREEEEEKKKKKNPPPPPPDPEEKRRVFIVTAAHPTEDGVFAEYGLLFQLKDLEEVSTLRRVVGGDGDDHHHHHGDGVALEELLVGSHHHHHHDGDDDELMGYGDLADIFDDDDEEDVIEALQDVMEMLHRTHYEATHDVVGRVRIHRFVDPERFIEDPPDGEEYLMAEATILLDDEERVGGGGTGESERRSTAPTANTLQRMEEELAEAVARVKEELRSSSVGETFAEQRRRQLHSEHEKDTHDSSSSAPKNCKGGELINNKNNNNRIIPPRTAGDNSSSRHLQVAKLRKDSLTEEERQLRESFAKLVALQHELEEGCRFTRVSVRTFGVGPVGVWLSAAAWSQFVEKRLEATYDTMQSDLQSKLAEFLADRDDTSSGHRGGVEQEVVGIEHGTSGLVEEAETIDFDDLSPQLQQEFQVVQARATEELGPLALERAIQMQRIVQAESYAERLDLLRECVDNERRRLEAKKMLKSLALKIDGKGGSSALRPGGRRESARSLFERLMSTSDANRDQVKDQDNWSFQ